MSRAFKSKHSKAMDAKEECKTYIKNLFAERARKGLPNDDVKDMSLIVQKGGFADDGWFQLKGKLNFMLNSPNPVQGTSSGYSSYGNWESSMQYVKSMVCDPAQYEKLCSKASYDDERALEGLKKEFDAAKSSGKKVEKRPEEWARAKEIVDRAKTGKKPQQQRSQFFEAPKAEPAHGGGESPENKAVLAEIAELLGSDLLTGSEKDKLILYRKMIPVALGISRVAVMQYVEEMKQEVAKRGGRAMERTSILKRCKALFDCGKLTIEEEDALRDMRSDAQEGVNFANIKADLDKLEKRVAARNVKIDVDGALADVLAPENAKFISFEALECVKRNLPGRGKLAEDWFADRVAEAHAELLENKPRGTIANGAEKPGNKAFIARIDAVLAAKAAGNNKLELDCYKISLQRDGLDSPSLQMLEKYLKAGEAKMNINATASRALSLDGLSNGEKDMILRMSGAQGRQQMTVAQLNERIEALADVITDANEKAKDHRLISSLNFNEFDGLVFRLGRHVDRASQGNSIASQKSMEAVAKIEKDARLLFEKNGLAFPEQASISVAQPQMTAGQLASKVLELRPALSKAFAFCSEQDELELGNLLARVNTLKDSLNEMLYNGKSLSAQQSFQSIQGAALPYLEKYDVAYET